MIRRSLSYSFIHLVDIIYNNYDKCKSKNTENRKPPVFDKQVYLKQHNQHIVPNRT